MKLLVYDKFWDALIDLPKTVQKKVNTFQKKFRENSKSSGIHLEPVKTFKDTSLRSARIDQEYRAIIKAPESGDVYYLLWVDHHDEAYRWAEHKLFQWNDVTQSVQMFTAPESVDYSHAEIQHIAIEETFFGKIDQAKLVKIGVPEVLLPSIRKINDLIGLEAVEPFIPSDVFENLFYLLEGANIDEVIYEINEGRITDSDLLVQVGSINNQRSFVELTDDTLFNEALAGSLHKWKYYLHPSQRKLVTSNFKGSLKVSGGAGTGKTVAALHRLKYLTEIMSDKETILFTTFTKALTENLTGLIKGLHIDSPNITVLNIDQVVQRLVNQYELLPTGFKVFEFDSVKNAADIWEEITASSLTSYSPEFLEAEYKQIILQNGVTTFDEYLKTSRKGRGKPVSRRQRKEIWEFIELFISKCQIKSYFYRDELFNKLSKYLKDMNITPFDYCLVDELQDFSNVELRLVRCLVKDKPNDLFMVGDPMQSIYNKQINFSNVGINIRGKRTHRLRINYRTTEEIKKLAVSIIADCQYDNFDGEEEARAGYISLYHGNNPTYTTYKTTEDEVNAVIKCIVELFEHGYQCSDIAICSRTKNGLKDFRSALHKKDIPYDDRSSETTNHQNSVSLLTFHKIKGLEFKHVFIVDANDRSIPKVPFDFDEFDKEEQNLYIKNERSMVYVAVTRAIENVMITGVGRKSELLKI